MQGMGKVKKYCVFPQLNCVASCRTDVFDPFFSNVLIRSTLSFSGNADRLTARGGGGPMVVTNSVTKPCAHAAPVQQHVAACSSSKQVQSLVK